jgi:hypothetical protein
MRYALHRRHSPATAKKAGAGNKHRTQDMDLPPRSVLVEKPAIPLAAAAERGREISVGSNEGIKTVKLRRSTVIWQKPKKAYTTIEPPATGDADSHSPVSLQPPAGGHERRPRLSFKKPIPASL